MALLKRKTVLDYIQLNPNRTFQQITKALGVTTASIQLHMANLRAEKAVHSVDGKVSKARVKLWRPGPSMIWRGPRISRAQRFEQMLRNAASPNSVFDLARIPIASRQHDQPSAER